MKPLFEPSILEFLVDMDVFKDRLESTDNLTEVQRGIS